MEINSYEVTLKADSGLIIIMTSATSEQQAINNVINVEHAPQSAVVKVDKLYAA